MNIGIWTASVVLGAGLPLHFLYDSGDSRQRASEWLAPWLLLAISAAVSGYFINEQGRELTAARADVSTYRDILHAQNLLPSRGGQPSTLHKVLLGTKGTKHVRILGINGLGVLHGHRKSLQEILRNPEHTIDVLLLDPESKAFENCAKEEEKGEDPDDPSRIEKEWVASIAILRDIAIQLRKSGAKAVEQRLKIRLHQAKPDRSLLVVATPEVYRAVPLAPVLGIGARQTVGVKPGRTEPQDNPDSKKLGKYLLLNIYPLSPKLSGQSSLSFLVNDTWVEYTENLAYFDCLWCCQDTVRMDVEKLIDYDNFSDFVIEDLRALLTQGTGGNFPPQEGLVEKEGASAWLDYFRPRTCRKKLRKAEMDLYPRGYSDPQCSCEPSQFLRMDYG